MEESPWSSKCWTFKFYLGSFPEGQQRKHGKRSSESSERKESQQDPAKHKKDWKSFIRNYPSSHASRETHNKTNMMMMKLSAASKAISFWEGAIMYTLPIFFYNFTTCFFQKKFHAREIIKFMLTCIVLSMFVQAKSRYCTRLKSVEKSALKSDWYLQNRSFF